MSQLTRNDLIKKIKDEGLLPDKEILKYKSFLNSMNGFISTTKAFEVFKDPKQKHYLQEFLTIKNVKEQQTFIKNNTGIRGIVKSLKENKAENSYKLGKGLATTKIVSLISAGTIPGLYIAGAVVARLAIPVAINYITDNFSNNNKTLKYIEKRISIIKEDYKENETIKNKNLNRIFRLIPESIYYNNNMSVYQKEKFFNESVKMLKSCDRYIKILLQNQQPQTVFNFLNVLREEVEKRNMTIEEITSKSKFFSNKGFASLQSHIFLKMLDTQETMVNVITKAKEAEKAIGDEFIEDAVGIFGKIGDKANIYKNINIGIPNEINKFIKIENITDPKSLYKDIISSNIEERLLNRVSGINGIMSSAEDIIKDTNTFTNDVIDLLIKNEKINKTAKSIIGKPINVLSEKSKEIPKIISEKLSEYSLSVNEKIDKINESIKNGKVNGKYGIKQACLLIDYLKESTQKIIKVTSDFIDNYIPIKDFLKETKKELLMVWNFYDKFKDGIRWCVVEGAGKLTNTSSKFENNFNGHEILNHKDKLTSGIKSQLNHIRKNANQINMVGSGDDIEKRMKKGFI